VDELGDTMIYPDMAPGWAVIPHHSKEWDFYYHAEKRLVTWSRPYVIPAKRAHPRVQPPSESVPDSVWSGTPSEEAHARAEALRKGVTIVPEDPKVPVPVIQKLEQDLDYSFGGIPPPKVLLLSHSSLLSVCMCVCF
jgi:hypothetical protein